MSPYSRSSRAEAKMGCIINATSVLVGTADISLVLVPALRSAMGWGHDSPVFAVEGQKWTESLRL